MQRKSTMHRVHVSPLSHFYMRGEYMHSMHVISPHLCGATMETCLILFDVIYGFGYSIKDLIPRN